MNLRKLALGLALLAPLSIGSAASAQQFAVDAGEEEDVGESTDELQGRPNSAASTACGCTVAGVQTDVSGLALFGTAALAAIVGVRRSRR